MSNLSLYDQLDHGIEVMLAVPFDADDAPALDDPTLREMLAIARELRHLPSDDFRESLRAELDAAIPTVAPAVIDDSPAWDSDMPILPTLFANAEPRSAANFAASFLLHAAALALIGTSGLWMVQHNQEVKQQVMTSIVTDPGEYIAPVAPTVTGGGGGGGDRDKLAATRGAPPRFAREQITPPAIVVRNEHPELVVPPTVVGPPSVKFPQMAMGDPLSGVTGPASNGTGLGGGIGSGSGGGVGSGRGPGVGPGWGGGIGGGAYRVGGGVSAPRALFAPDPEYSEEARKAKYQGMVVLWLVVGPDGRVHEARVQRSLGMGLDEKALESVRKWKFEPAQKDGRPVAVQINVEVSFRLY